jgi:hypothetical protein
VTVKPKGGAELKIRLIIGLVLLTMATLGSNSAVADFGHYGAGATLSLTSSTPGAVRGSTLTLTTPIGDFATSETISFEPAGASFTLGCNKPGYRDLDNDNVMDAGETPCLAAGGAAGTHTHQARYGLSNGPCFFTTSTAYNLFSIPMPNNELAPRTATNLVYPRPEGSADRFGGWQVGSEPPAAGGTAPVDVDVNGVAEATSLTFQNYPKFLLDLFDPDGAGALQPVLPRAVYGGLAQVHGDWTPVYNLQFGAGVLATAFTGESPHPFARAVAALGQPTVLVVGDPTATTASIPSQITDVCGPSTTTVQLNTTVGGVTRATNPSVAGTHLNLVWQISQRDLDNDSYENPLDTCPLIANVENPRSNAGADGDMIDSACDPTPVLNTNVGDHDGDGFPNAADNCPVVANATQAEGEAVVPPDYPAASPDGGPVPDGIGSACDSGIIVITLNGVNETITASSTVANGHWHVVASAIPRCYGGTDADSDGYCTTEDTADSGACAGMVPPSCVVRHNAWTTTPALSLLLSFDTDQGGADTLGATDPGGVGSPCPGGASDICAETGFDSDWIETYTIRESAQPCSSDSLLNNEGSDAWVWDVNDDTRANLSDIVALGPAYGLFVNAPNGDIRFDMNSDGAVNLSDLVAYGPAFNKQCQPQRAPQ